MEGTADDRVQELSPHFSKQAGNHIGLWKRLPRPVPFRDLWMFSWILGPIGGGHSSLSRTLASGTALLVLRSPLVPLPFLCRVCVSVPFEGVTTATVDFLSNLPTALLLIWLTQLRIRETHECHSPCHLEDCALFCKSWCKSTLFSRSFQLVLNRKS